MRRTHLLASTVTYTTTTSTHWWLYESTAVKGKESKAQQIKRRLYLYRAFKYARILTKRSDMDHTVLPANNTMPAFPT